MENNFQNIPRRELLKFKSWLIQQEEWKQLTDPYMRNDDKESTMKLLYLKFKAQPQTPKE